MSLPSELTQLGSLFIAAAAGVALGTGYFGCLWLSVRGLPRRRHPLTGMLISFVARSLVLLTGIYAVTDGHWPRLLACLSGFLLARSVLLHRAGALDTPAGAVSEAGRPLA